MTDAIMRWATQAATNGWEQQVRNAAPHLIRCSRLPCGSSRYLKIKAVGRDISIDLLSRENCSEQRRSGPSKINENSEAAPYLLLRTQIQMHALSCSVGIRCISHSSMYGCHGLRKVFSRGHCSRCLVLKAGCFLHVHIERRTVFMFHGEELYFVWVPNED